MAKTLIVIGILFIAAGIVWLVMEHIGISRFLGNLPGDFSFTKGNVSFHFPLMTCLIISVVLTFILNLFFRH